MTETKIIQCVACKGYFSPITQIYSNLCGVCSKKNREMNKLSDQWQVYFKYSEEQINNIKQSPLNSYKLFGLIGIPASSIRSIRNGNNRRSSP